MKRDLFYIFIAVLVLGVIFGALQFWVSVLTALYICLGIAVAAGVGLVMFYFFIVRKISEGDIF